MKTTRLPGRLRAPRVAKRTDPCFERPRLLRRVQPREASRDAGAPDGAVRVSCVCRFLRCLRRLFAGSRPDRRAPASSDVSRRMFLAETQRDIGSALCAIETGDFDVVLDLARQFAREGHLHDFPRLSHLGDALARAILREDVRAARTVAQLVMQYLSAMMDELPLAARAD